MLSCLWPRTSGDISEYDKGLRVCNILERLGNWPSLLIDIASGGEIDISASKVFSYRAQLHIAFVFVIIRQHIRTVNG